MVYGTVGPMRDVYRMRSKNRSVGSVMSTLKETLGNHSFTVYEYDLRAGRFSARMTSTLRVVTGTARAVTVTVQEDGLGRMRIETTWRGALKGCALTFVEASLISLIIGRDFGVGGLLISFLVGTSLATANLAHYLVNRLVMKRRLVRSLGMRSK